VKRATADMSLIVCLSYNFDILIRVAVATAAAPFARWILDLRNAWGSASLHPRLYAFTRYAGCCCHPSAARCKVGMSIFFICSIAFITRCDFSASLLCSNSGNTVGVICHDRPYLSLSQPH
jgi:hypothetical protein